MFYALAIASMLAYALQSTLLVRHARTIDGLSLAFYRNISFVITLLPLTFGSSHQDIAQAFTYMPKLLLAGLLGGIGLALLFTALRAIPAGVATAFSTAAKTMLMTFFSWIFLGEILTPAALWLIVVIVSGCIVLGVQRNPMKHLTNMMVIGLGLVFLSSISHASTMFIYAEISRKTNPLLIGYMWEVSIGLATFAMLLVRLVFFKKHIEKISWKNFGDIAICVSPTLIGTGCLGLAVQLGPIGIVSAIGAGSLFITTVLSHWWYGEVLNRGQWIGLFLILIGVACMKFVI